MVKCRNCDEGYQDDGATEVVRQAIAEADKASLRLIIESLEKERVTMAYMERALGLAPRTIARWKAGETSAAGLALLRIVRTFPWILRVARARFDASAAQREVESAAFAMRGTISEPQSPRDKCRHY
jgi:hypothetical protein